MMAFIQPIHAPGSDTRGPRCKKSIIHKCFTVFKQIVDWLIFHISHVSVFCVHMFFCQVNWMLMKSI